MGNVPDWQCINCHLQKLNIAILLIVKYYRLFFMSVITKSGRRPMFFEIKPRVDLKKTIVGQSSPMAPKYWK